MDKFEEVDLIKFLLQVGETRLAIKNLLIKMEIEAMEGTEDWCTELYNIYCKLYIGEPDV